MNEKRPETYEEARDFLLKVPRFTENNQPGSMHLLLDVMGHPEQKFRVIHVAGTNGKGSVCAFLESIFRSAGMRTGLFTSPHLERINERFKILGEDIGDEEFLDVFCTVYDAAENVIKKGGSAPVFSDYLFAMGLCWFAREGIDLLVCETGLGGRLDATNAMSSVWAVVITSISLDHMEYLGDTVEKIAGEKAGIIKPGVPVIYCAMDPSAARVIERRCEELGAEKIPAVNGCVSVIDRDNTSIECNLNLPDGNELRLHIPFAAGYQTENAALAALCALKCGVCPETVQEGIARTIWPGRMEEICRDVFLDGAHNLDAVCRLSEEIERIAKTRKVSLLAAIVADKDHGAMVERLCEAAHYESVIATSAGGKRRMDAQVLAQTFTDRGQQGTEAVDAPGEALREALSRQKDSVLICTGSLYLIGEIRSLVKKTAGPLMTGFGDRLC